MRVEAIETVYDGHLFRSRLEARWAVFFNTVGLKYSYEQEGYRFMADSGERVQYLPDFYMVDEEYWVEVKGKKPKAKALQKVKLLARYREEEVVVLWGPIPSPLRPHELGMWVVLPDGSLLRQCTWIMDLESDKARPTWIDSSNLGMVSKLRADPVILRGYEAARRARFMW